LLAGAIEGRGVGVAQRHDLGIGAESQTREMILQGDPAATDDGNADGFHERNNVKRKLNTGGEYAGPRAKGKPADGFGAGGGRRERGNPESGTTTEGFSVFFSCEQLSVSLRPDLRLTWSSLE
jgi:hypothetical protein